MAAPLADRDLTLHIGGYGTWRVPEMSGKTERFVEFRTFPESRTDRRRFVRAEIFNVKSYYTVGAELAFRWRKLLVYGEYIFTELSRYGLSGGERIPLKNASFNGWYATASYMLRGEQRRYAPEDAEFGPMEVRRGGNLELAVRASNINMNDFHDARAVITGGAATSYSASLNWYPNRNVLIGLNYTYMDNDKYADDKGHITLDGKPLSQMLPSGLDFSILQLRLLLSF